MAKKPYIHMYFATYNKNDLLMTKCNFQN